MSNLFTINNLVKDYSVGRSIFGGKSRLKVHAVDNINFKINEGERVALIGESGCGKTTTGLIILKLLDPTSGKVFFENEDIFSLRGNDLKKFRSKVQMVFQHPFSSFNPRRTIGDALKQPYNIHKPMSKDELENTILNLLKKVELSPPESFVTKYPHEVSGGQLQRVAIARSITLNPKFILLDEPVSALDMSVRGGILNLLNKLHNEEKLTRLTISHDLAVVRSTTDLVNVMYLGRIVESAKTAELFNNPIHPYTKYLISSCLVPDPTFKRSTQKLEITGFVPSPINLPEGCSFHPRCPHRMRSKCNVIRPELVELQDHHYAACHFVR